MAGHHAKNGMWLKSSAGKRVLVTQSMGGGGLPQGSSEAEIADKVSQLRQQLNAEAKAKRQADVASRTIKDSGVTNAGKTEETNTKQERREREQFDKDNKSFVGNKRVQLDQVPFAYGVNNSLDSKYNQIQNNLQDIQRGTRGSGLGYSRDLTKEDVTQLKTQTEKLIKEFKEDAKKSRSDIKSDSPLKRLDDKIIAKAVQEETEKNGIGKIQKAYIAARVLEEIGKDPQAMSSMRSGLLPESYQGKQLNVNIPGGANYTFPTERIPQVLLRFGIKHDKLQETANELNKLDPNYKPEKKVKEKASIPTFKKDVVNITVRGTKGLSQITVIGKSYKDFTIGKIQGEPSINLHHRPSGLRIPASIRRNLSNVPEGLSDEKFLRIVASQLNGNKNLPKVSGGYLSKANKGKIRNFLESINFDKY